MTELVEVVRSIPRRPATVWQVAVVRLPFQVHGEDGGVFRVEIALCLDLVADLVTSTEPQPEGTVAAGELVRRVLAQAAASWGYVPETLAISDPKLSADLRKALAGTGVSVRVEPELAGLERVLALMAEAFLEREREAVPDVLSGEGVTVAGVAAFARAAQRFQEAAPWRFLSNEDLSSGWRRRRWGRGFSTWSSWGREGCGTG
jgi:hypothetical protein